MAPFVSSKATLLHVAETLLVAACGGLTFALLGLPAGLIMGSLLTVAVAALLGRPMTAPLPLARVIYVLVGISLGAVVTPDTLHGIATFPLSIAVLTVATISMIVATTSYLRFVHGWDLQSAVFGSSPGGLAQVMSLAAEYGADLRAIAIVQVMRVVLLTIGIPTGLALFGLSASGGGFPRASAVESTSLELAILVAVSTFSALVMTRLRFPGGLLFGAMIGSGILHGGGFIKTGLPFWAVTLAVIGIGAVTGSRFANTAPRQLLRYIWAALGSFAVALSVASAFVVLLTTFLSVRIPDAVVAFAPGAQDTMMVLALSLHLDPVFVGAHQVWRFLLVSLSLPLQARRVGKIRSRAKVEPPPRQRLPSED
jgi:membrane AbrB-like protein